MTSMRAIVCRTYGPPDVLELAEVGMPPVGDGDIRVRVRAAALNPLDLHFLTGTPHLARLAFGWRGPRRAVPGVDMAGTVQAVGPGVTEFRPGDDVFGVAEGSLAEYASVREDSIVAKPGALSFEQAASTPVAGVTALQALRDHAKLEAGQHVLVNGASGGVGTFAVQVAKVLGAEVTGVCSTANVGLVRSIGADHVVDYTREDVARSVRRWHVLLDNVGNLSPADCRRVLHPRGTCILVSGPRKSPLLAYVLRTVGTIIACRASGRRALTMLARRRKPDLVELGRLIAAGKVVPVLDGTWSLAEAREAFRHLMTGHARGKIVITL